MDVAALLNEIATNKIRPVVAIDGAERILIDRALDALRKATVGGGPRALSEDHFEATQMRVAKVLDTCRMLPMLSRYRFVMVRSAEEWKLDEHDMEALVAYLSAPAASTVLVLLFSKLDRRTKLASTLLKHDIVIDAFPPKERELPGWVEVEAKRRGAKLSQGVAASLVMTIGADLSGLADALDRLTLFAAGRAITEADVEQVVVSLREASQFELPDAIADRQLARALSVTDNLMRQRKPGLFILAFVARQMRLLARARDAIDSGDDLGSVLKLPPFVVSKLAAQARKWSSRQIVAGLLACAEADRRLKSGGGRDRDARVLEALVLALLSDAMSASA